MKVSSSLDPAFLWIAFNLHQFFHALCQRTTSTTSQIAKWSYCKNFGIRFPFFNPFSTILTMQYTSLLDNKTSWALPWIAAVCFTPNTSISNQFRKTIKYDIFEFFWTWIVDKLIILTSSKFQCCWGNYTWKVAQLFTEHLKAAHKLLISNSNFEKFVHMEAKPFWPACQSSISKTSDSGYENYLRIFSLFKCASYSVYGISPSLAFSLNHM